MKRRGFFRKLGGIACAYGIGQQPIPAPVERVESPLKVDTCSKCGVKTLAGPSSSHRLNMIHDVTSGKYMCFMCLTKQSSGA